MKKKPKETIAQRNERISLSKMMLTKICKNKKAFNKKKERQPIKITF
jgi:hypothetical protein